MLLKHVFSTVGQVICQMCTAWKFTIRAAIFKLLTTHRVSLQITNHYLVLVLNNCAGSQAIPKSVHVLTHRSQID